MINWQTTTLDDILKIGSGKASKYSRDDDFEYDVYGSNGKIGTFKDYNFTNGFLIGRVGGVGTVHQISQLIWASDNTLTAELKDDTITFKDFIRYMLIYLDLERYSTKTAQPLLTQRNIKQIKINLPPFRQQKKIAAILSSVDEAIEKTEQIIEQTETVKKGLMQELLTKGIGHTEFKDSSIGRIPLKWELKQLEEISFINMGQSPSSKDCYDFEKGLPFYQGNADFGDLHPVPVKWCEKPRKVADKDDILISVRAPVGEINIADSECCIGRGLSAIKPKEISHSFLYYLLEYYKKDLERKSQGSTFTAINKGDLTSLILPIPKREEQIKIVGILENKDSKIFNEKINLKVLNKLKRGLMQQLLTGKTRVKVDDSEEVTT